MTVPLANILLECIYKTSATVVYLKFLYVDPDVVFRSIPCGLMILASFSRLKDSPFFKTIVFTFNLLIEVY